MGVAGPKSERSLEKALTAKKESKSVEFKERFDVQSTADWCEIVKDVVALANSSGGTILFGVNNSGAPVGIDVSAVAALDPAVIVDKVNRYTGSQFADFQVGSAKKGRTKLAYISIEPVGIPLVFTQPGTYAAPNGNQKTAFSKGTVYFRHGAKSEPGTTEDLRRSFDRQLSFARREWMKGVSKVTKAPIGARLVVLPGSARHSEEGDATPIQVVDDPSAPKYRLIDTDKQYPYRQKELVKLVQEGLPPGQVITPYDVLCIRQIHKIEDNKVFFHRPKFASPQYSSEFAEWVLDQVRRDNKFLERTRKKAKKLRA